MLRMEIALLLLVAFVAYMYYMELMCSRYPNLRCEYDIDPNLGGAQVPNFILQPIVENSMLHDLKNKGYQGKVEIIAQKTKTGCMEISVRDTGSGFTPEKKAAVDALLHTASTVIARLCAHCRGNLRPGQFIGFPFS